MNLKVYKTYNVQLIAIVLLKKLVHITYFNTNVVIYIVSNTTIESVSIEDG